MQNFRQQWLSWSKMGQINEFYEIEGRKIIGSGKYGQVVRVRQKGQNRLFKAIRIIPKSKVRNVPRFKQDLNSLRNLNNATVIRIQEAFEDVRNLYFVLDLCEGGTLYEKILEKHVLASDEVRIIFTQMAQAINICHKYALCHKDLRPESFLYMSRKPDDINLKLADIGFQLIYVDDFIKKQKGVVVESSRKGKLYYTAPEIFEGRLTEKCDIWSLGVILHVLLTGELPFCGQNDDEIYENIQQINLSIKVEGYAKDLLEKILCKQEKRISMFDILRHPWLLDTSEPKQFLNLNFVQMKQLSNQNQLQKIMMNFISEQVEQEQLNEINKILESLDTKGTGLISIEALKKELNDNKQQEIYQLLQYVESEDGVINYLDFQNQIMEKRVFLKEERIYAAFKQFDLNNTGQISNENLWTILTTLDQFKHISKEFCSSLISEVDKNNDGLIDYLEFIDMFFKKNQQ